MRCRGVFISEASCSSNRFGTQSCNRHKNNNVPYVFLRLLDRRRPLILEKKRNNRMTSFGDVYRYITHKNTLERAV